MFKISKEALRELALDAYTTPNVTVTVVPPKKRMADIRKKAFLKRAEEFYGKTAQTA